LVAGLGMGRRLAWVSSKEQTPAVALSDERRSETRYADVDGVQIAYRVIGDGPLELV
jgi:hypothetical protein